MDPGREKRQVLHRQAREIVFKVYLYFVSIQQQTVSCGEGKERDVATPQMKTATACGIGLRTVQRITSFGNKNNAVFKSPGKNIKRKKPVTDLDDFNKNLLRTTIFDMYKNGEYPTALKLVQKMKKAVGFNGSRDSILRILKNMGFCFKKCSDGRKFLMERIDIVAARIAFLRKIHKIREAGKSFIFYLDETYIHQNHSRSACWQMSDGSGGLRVPVGKGGRLIVLHAGSSVTGFIPQCKLIFRSKSKSSNSDYHKDMDYSLFKKWFVENLLPNIPLNSTIVMDNASIHSVQLDRAPSTNTRKADIISWLSRHNIPHLSTQKREELLTLVRLFKSKTVSYEIDSIAEQHGHQVVRLPPYHCHYNPIELIWAQMKSYVAEKNNTFKMADVETLTHEAIENVSTEAWENCVRHAEKLQEEDYAREIPRDDIMEPFIINLEDSDEESEDDDDANDDHRDISDSD